MFARRRSNIYFWLLETVTIITLVKMTAGSGEFCHLKSGIYAKTKVCPALNFPHWWRSLLFSQSSPLLFCTKTTQSWLMVPFFFLSASQQFCIKDTNSIFFIIVTGNRIPTPLAFLRSLTHPSRVYTTFNASNTPLTNLLSNPYTLSPLLFCLAMFCIAVFLPPWVSPSLSSIQREKTWWESLHTGHNIVLLIWFWHPL